MFDNLYEGKKVLITGLTGFKGSWLGIWLKRLKAEVIGVSLAPNTSPSLFEICKLYDRFRHYEVDIRDLNHVKKIFRDEKPEIVFHLAAQPLVRRSYKEPVETFETNVLGTVNVLEAAKCSETVRAMVIITTDKCYENKEWQYGYRESDPLGGYDPYSASKACAEIVVNSYRQSFMESKKIGLATARAGNVIGGGDWADDRLIPDFVRSVSQKQSMEIRNPYATRPWQHVMEPLAAYMLLGARLYKQSEEYSSAWNFGPFDDSVICVKEIIKKSMNYWRAGNVIMDTSVQPHEAKLLKLDISKAIYKLKWKPLFGIDDTIQHTMKWYKTYYENLEDENISEIMYDLTNQQIENYTLQLQNRGD